MPIAQLYFPKTVGCINQYAKQATPNDEPLTVAFAQRLNFEKFFY